MHHSMLFLLIASWSASALCHGEVADSSTCRQDLERAALGSSMLQAYHSNFNAIIQPMTGPITEEEWVDSINRCCEKATHDFILALLTSMSLQVCDSGCHNSFVPKVHCKKKLSFDDLKKRIRDNSEDKCGCYASIGNCTTYPDSCPKGDYSPDVTLAPCPPWAPAPKTETQTTTTVTTTTVTTTTETTTIEETTTTPTTSSFTVSTTTVTSTTTGTSTTFTTTTMLCPGPADDINSQGWKHQHACVSPFDNEEDVGVDVAPNYNANARTCALGCEILANGNAGCCYLEPGPAAYGQICKFYIGVATLQGKPSRKNGWAQIGLEGKFCEQPSGEAEGAGWSFFDEK